MTADTIPTPTDQQTNHSADKPFTLSTGQRNLLQYAGYFLGIGGLMFVTQTGEPKQIENAVMAGAIASGAVVSRDWYKARLDPSMAADPTALIQIFSELLHAGRAQVNTNASHLKRVEFLQQDLTDAMVQLNDQLRLSPEAVEQQLRSVQTNHLASAFSTVRYPTEIAHADAATHMPAPIPTPDTYVPDSTTVRQSTNLRRRPGFDA